MPVRRTKGEFTRVRKIFGGARISVGFPKETTGGQTYPNGEKISRIAAIQEFGNPDNKMYGNPAPIPPRPALRNGIARFAKEEKEFIEKAVTDAMLGRITYSQAYLRISVKAADVVRQEFTRGDWVENSPVTIERKGSSQPLIDSGMMRQAVDAIVKD